MKVFRRFPFLLPCSDLAEELTDIFLYLEAASTPVGLKLRLVPVKGCHSMLTVGKSCWWSPLGCSWRRTWQGWSLLRCLCVLGMAVAVAPQIQHAPTLQKAHLLSRGMGGI